MFDRWRELDPSQRRLIGVLSTLVLGVALVAGVVAFTGSGSSHEAVRTDQSSTSSSTEATSSIRSIRPGDPSTSTSISTSGSAPGASSTTVQGGTTTPKAGSGTGGSGTGGTGTTVTTAGSGGTTTTAATTRTTTATTVSTAACNPGGGNGNANQIADLFCRYRSDHGLAKMTRNGALDQEAQTWAQKMATDAANGVPAGTALAHNLDPSTGYKAAVRADCSRCTGWAENVAYDTSAANAWAGWLVSSGHLANITDGHAGEYGVGVAQGGGYLWFVQDFGRYP